MFASAAEEEEDEKCLVRVESRDATGDEEWRARVLRRGITVEGAAVAMPLPWSKGVATMGEERARMLVVGERRSRFLSRAWAGRGRREGQESMEC